MGIITLKQAAAWCGGTVAPEFEQVTFFGANNDTRKLQPGQLFVALEGVRDGHDFIDAALQKGAAAVLCKRIPVGGGAPDAPQNPIPGIFVDNPRTALGRIAAGYRQSLGITVVGVTGSVGKSTTKEMIAAVLEGSYRVSKTPANFNNDLGLPMAILAMPADTQVAVLEMGMNHFREIAYLSNIARPDMGVIINVGTMHIEHLGSREGILQAKLEILEGMAENAPLFINGDNDLLAAWQPTHKTLNFGTAQGCAVRAEEIREAPGSISYTACHGEQRFAVQLPLEGMHYVADSLAAVSVGLQMGVTPADIARRLAAFRTMEGRQEIFEAKGMTIIKDCYNAGPESMAAALAVLGKRPGRRIAVLGDMLELGDCAPAEHEKVGRLAAQNADYILAYGPHAAFVAKGTKPRSGSWPPCAKGAVSEADWGIAPCEVFNDRAAMAHRLKALAQKGDVLLFKGSHGMHMELVLEGFLKEET